MCEEANFDDILIYQRIHKTEYIDNWIDDATVYYNCNKKYKPNRGPEDYLFVVGYPAVNQKIKDIIDRVAINDKIQYLPIKVVDRLTGLKYLDDKFYIPNILTELDAVVPEKSEYFGPYVRKAYLSPEITAGHHIFNVKNHFSAQYVSEELKNEFEKAKVTGMAFFDTMNNE
jgi:hypothetical protein